MDAEADKTSELMRRYASGENHVFEELYAAMAPRLYRFCLRLARDKAQANDYFQETFLKLHRARATYIAGANPLHWAFAIARSIHLDRLRYQRRHPEDLGFARDATEEGALPADARFDPEAELRMEDLAAVVSLELDKMSEKNRTAYILLREENVSVKEAAAALGTTPDAVKQRAHRACEQLRAAVGAAGWASSEDASPESVRNA